LKERKDTWFTGCNGQHSSLFFLMTQQGSKIHYESKINRQDCECSFNAVFVSRPSFRVL